MNRAIYEIYLKALRDNKRIDLEEVDDDVYKFTVRAGVAWAGPEEKVMYLGLPQDVMRYMLHD